MRDIKIEIVDNLNNQLTVLNEQFNSCSGFNYSTCGHCEAIKFGDEIMWDDEDYDAEEDETIENCIIGRFNEYIDNLTKLKIPEFIWDYKGYEKLDKYYGTQKDWNQGLSERIEIIKNNTTNETIITDSNGENIINRTVIYADSVLYGLFMSLEYYNSDESILNDNIIVNYKDGFNNMIEVNGKRIKVINAVWNG